jgi:hypothetical protein
MADETPSDTALGYGLFGLAIGLALFALTYIVTTRAGMATPTDATWLAIFLALLLAPAVIAGLVGLNKAKKNNQPGHP